MRLWRSPGQGPGHSMEGSQDAFKKKPRRMKEVSDLPLKLPAEGKYGKYGGMQGTMGGARQAKMWSLPGKGRGMGLWELSLPSF